MARGRTRILRPLRPKGCVASPLVESHSFGTESSPTRDTSGTSVDRGWFPRVGGVRTVGQLQGVSARGVGRRRDPRDRDLVRRDGRRARHARRRDPRERRRLAGRAARALRRRRARDRVAAAPRARLARASARRSTRPARRSTTSRRSPSRAGPGLIGALLVGLAAAKALAWARGLPLVPVNHLHGHVASLYLQPLDLEPPFTCLLASGGHTLLLDVRDRYVGGRARARARRSTTRPARRSTRARGCSGSATRAAPRSTGSRARATPRRTPSRSRACRGSTSPSPG